jgi:hemerythrin-like domain-containing protein
MRALTGLENTRMPMKATEQLKAEHQGIMLMMKILEKICSELEAGSQANADHLAKIVDFFEIFVDKCHHGKEEGLLFPELESAGIPKEGGPIGVMLAEHDHGRAYVRGLKDAVARYESGDKAAAAEVVSFARKYMELLSQHINKEDNVLFAMADSTLSEDRQDKLYEAFERLEVEKIGLGRHEEFHELLDRLAKEYLN